MRENYTLARLYLDHDLAEDAVIALSKEQAHYLGNVLRLSSGDALRVFNSKDGEWRALVADINRKAARIEITEQLRAPKPCPDIWLCFAPVRKHRNAFILEKATELGVGTLQPLITARTQFPKIRLDKMQAQIIEASEQTERLDLPMLCETRDLSKMLDNWPEGRALIFADEAGDAEPAMNVLQNLSGPAALLIGPEGGFTAEEREILRAKSFVTAVTLGPRILRADTAALSMLTLWQACSGDWK